MSALSRRALVALSAGLAALIGGARAAVPAGRVIHLIDTYVAGTPYYAAAAAYGSLTPGAPLALRRQPDNRYDDLAIEVLAPDGRKLGYVPRRDNAVLARLMDAGRRLDASLLAAARYEHGGIQLDMAIRLVE